MQAAVVIDLSLLLLVHNLVFECQLGFFLVWHLHNAELFQHLLFKIILAMDGARDLLLESEELHPLLRQVSLHKSQNGVIVPEGKRKVILAKLWLDESVLSLLELAEEELASDLDLHEVSSEED
jgi:hypothetical protein